MLDAAIALMIAALTFYSIGVWRERFAGRLQPHHVAFFALGLCCDTAGTELMRRIVGGYELNAHAVTGALALVLMLVHALWAAGVLCFGGEKALTTFHRFSVAVWAFWLVPFVSGMVMARMPRA